MPQLRFDSVPFLLAIPVALALVVMLRARTRDGLGRLRRALSLAARSLGVALLLAAMSGPSWTERQRAEAVTVLLLDVSDSMGPTLRDAAARIESLSREASARGEKTALVVFAGRAEIVRPPAIEPVTVPARWIDPERKEGLSPRLSLDPSRTDFARALRAAETVAPPATDILFVTDGRDPLETLPHRPNVRFARISFPGQDVSVTAVQAPSSVRTGEPFDARVEVHATTPQVVDLVVLVDDAEIRRERVRIPEGSSTVGIRGLQTTLAQGPHRMVVFARAEADAERRNDYAGTSIFALGRPRVLLLEESPAAGEALAKLLRAQEFDVRRIPPARLAEEPLGEYAAAVSVGVRAGSFSVRSLEALHGYVRSGGGFWLVPPPDPNASAEYARSPLASWLPVEFEPSSTSGGSGRDGAKRGSGSGTDRTDPTTSATVALLLLVDKSGSMAGDKLELVKEACRVTAETLGPGDSIGVLAFDTKPHWVVEFTAPDRKEFIRDQLYRLLADGGTDIFPALVEAHRAILTHARARAAGIKHVVLFSDGDTRPADIPGQVRRMAEAGISLSTVCILLQDFDLFLMKEIAELGRGRFRYTSSFAHVPKLFTEEARTLLDKRPGKKENDRSTQTDTRGGDQGDSSGSLLPKKLEEHEILWEGLPARLPPLQAILPSKRKEGARVPLGTSEGRPLLALTRVGLGRAAVWTSDLEGRWSGEWLRWGETPKLFAHLVRHLSSAAETPDLADRVTIRSGKGRIHVRVSPDSGEERIRLGRLRPDREEIPFRPDPDGSLRATVEASDDPTPLILTRESSGRVERVTLLVPQPYPAEYLPTPPVSREGGRRSPAPERERKRPATPWLLLAATLLLPLDVALRRIR